MATSMRQMNWHNMECTPDGGTFNYDIRTMQTTINEWLTLTVVNSGTWIQDHEKQQLVCRQQYIRHRESSQIDSLPGESKRTQHNPSPHHRTRVISSSSNDGKNRGSIKFIPTTSRKHNEDWHALARWTSQGDCKWNSLITGLINQFKKKRKLLTK